MTGFFNLARALTDPTFSDRLSGLTIPADSYTRSGPPSQERTKMNG